MTMKKLVFMFFALSVCITARGTYNTNLSYYKIAKPRVVLKAYVKEPVLMYRLKQKDLQ